jgi:hypothetical protein
MGNGRLKARNKNCHKEKIAPTRRLKVKPTKIILSNLSLPLINPAKVLPRIRKQGSPKRSERRSEACSGKKIMETE